MDRLSLQIDLSMRVLVACEFSGVVRDAFLARGHDAISCDIEPSETPGPHIQGDVRELLTEAYWDMLIAFPPCTYLSNLNGLLGRWGDANQDIALSFVLDLMNAPIPRICVENPAGAINTRIEKPTQIINPYMFGHPYRKRTCLWLQGLPPLKPTMPIPKSDCVPWVDGLKRDTETRSRERSRTFTGVAQAMADQWG